MPCSTAHGSRQQAQWSDEIHALVRFLLITHFLAWFGGGYTTNMGLEK